MKMKIFKATVLTLMMLFIVFSTLATIGFSVSYLLDITAMDGKNPTTGTMIFARIVIGLCLVGTLHGFNKIFDLAVDTFKYGFNHESTSE